MSRFFNGGFAADRIFFSPGNTPNNQGGITIVSLVKPAVADFTGYIVNGYDTGGFSKFGQLVAATGPARVFITNDFGAGGPIAGTDWCWLASVHAAGNGPPEHYRGDISDDTWSHVTGSANVNDFTGARSTVVVGNVTAGGAGDSWRGWMAAIGIFAGALTLSEIQAACTHSAKDLLDAGVDWGVLFNQTDVATPVLDFTGNHGDQTSIEGTSVDAAEEPPGWSYSLTGTTPGPTMSLWDGTSEVAVTATLWDGSSEQPVSLSSIT